MAKDLKKPETIDPEKMGKICCCECEKPLAWFNPETGGIDEDSDIELYCEACMFGERKLGVDS